MKKLLCLLAVVTVLFAACRVKYGCPTSARNMGAEKLIAGQKDDLKSAKRAGKFKGSKF